MKKRGHEFIDSLINNLSVTLPQEAEDPTSEHDLICEVAETPCFILYYRDRAHLSALTRLALLASAELCIENS